MARVLNTASAYIRAFLIGPGLVEAIRRHDAAVDELDKALKEIWRR